MTVHPSCRLSQEYLTGQVTEISTQLKGLHKKLKKAPDDLQQQLKAFLKEATDEMALLTASLESVQERSKEIANYFCEDSSKFKLEGLFMELNAFTIELEQAKKVWSGAHSSPGMGYVLSVVDEAGVK